ncbi:MAG: hypothetical protein VB100_03055 [Angelakisella sp.]|nr:hypothetical protein [Angelakisella sp.]
MTDVGDIVPIVEMKLYMMMTWIYAGNKNSLAAKLDDTPALPAFFVPLAQFYLYRRRTQQVLFLGNTICAFCFI